MAISVYKSLLIKDYKRKASEIKALRRELRELAKLMLKKEKELAAIATIVHSDDPDYELAAIKPNATYAKISKLKWGQLTAMIYNCLREANGEAVSTELIFDYIVEKGNVEIKDRTDAVSMRLSLRKRLKNLVAAKKIVRHHNKQTNRGGSWSLPSSE